MKARGLSIKKVGVLKRSPAVKATMRAKAASENFNVTYLPSPNLGGVLKPEGIVLHHSCGSWAGDQSWITQAKSRVSYHCLINTDGRRVEFVPYNRVAWHAGVSSFYSRPYCNYFMLGLAFTGDTVSGVGRPQKLLLKPELASAVEWVRARMAEFGIKWEWITTHAAIAPGRKDDVSDAVFRQVVGAL